MKVKKLIELLEVIDGKLPSDMQVLPDYIYDGDNTNAPIGDMDFVHFVRSFVKMKTTLNEEVRRDTQEGKVAHLEDKCEHLERVLQIRQDNLDFLHKKLSSQERARVMRIKDLNKQNHALQELNIQMNERNQDLHKRLEEKSYREVTAPRYMFSEIPNDCDGQRFTDDMKQYLNTSRYSMHVRGQHVKEEYKGTGVTAYGQNIEQSTHLRVYIEEKD